MALDAGLLDQLMRGIGGGAPGSTPGTVPMGGGLDAAAGLPYAAGAPVANTVTSPLTNELFGAMYQRGPYAGLRGVMKESGLPNMLPQSTPGRAIMPFKGGPPETMNPAASAYASQVQALGGGQAAIGPGPVNVNPMGVNATPFANNGPGGMPMGAGVNPTTMPYSGTGPFANNGPGPVPGQGVNGNIPQSLYTAEAATASPGTIPMGAGAGTGAGSMPYTGGAPVGGTMAGGGGGSVPPTGTATAAGAAEEAAAGGGRLSGLLSRLRGGGGAAAAAEGAAGETAAVGGLRGVLSAGGMKGALGRGALGIGAGYGLGKAADAAGQGIAGQFLEGASIGAPAGSIASLPGMAVGALGVGLGNVLTQGGVGDLIHGGQQSAMDQFMATQTTKDPSTGQDVLTPVAQVMASLNDPTDDTFAAMGIDPDTAKTIQDQYTADIAGTGSGEGDQQARIAALQKAATATLAAQQATQQGGIQGMLPSDIAAMQILATQLFAPVAADSAAIGNMQQDALSALAPSLPSQYQDVLARMGNHAHEGGNRMANAYIQQAGAIPQIHALGRQQALIDQTSSQLASQALGSIINPGSGSGSGLDALLQAQGNGGASSQDIIAALANAGQ